MSKMSGGECVASGEGLEVSNRGGTWHSPPNLAQQEEPLLQQATQEILAAVGAAHQAVTQTFAGEQALPAASMGIQMWAMVMPHGGYVIPHHHAQHDWSAILYLDAGDADPTAPSGQVVFQDPHLNDFALTSLIKPILKHEILNIKC